MTIARTISTDADWDNLPVGTLARVDYLEHEDDGTETGGGTMSILRVEGDFRANAGDCMLAGGKYWAEVWVWQQGVVALEPAAIHEEFLPGLEPMSSAQELAEAFITVHDTLESHKARVEAINKMPLSEYRRLRPEELPPKSPAVEIVNALQARGWAPPPVYPEGVQVWTVSGIPDGGVSDGSQAYLSLPAGPRDKQLRSDIWLKNPTVTVNFELPARRIN